jgi:hypothetical protein
VLGGERGRLDLDRPAHDEQVDEEVLREVEVPAGPEDLGRELVPALVREHLGATALAAADHPEHRERLGRLADDRPAHAELLAELVLGGEQLSGPVAAQQDALHELARDPFRERLRGGDCHRLREYIWCLTTKSELLSCSTLTVNGHESRG